MKNSTKLKKSLAHVKWWVHHSSPGDHTVYHIGPSFFNEADRPTIARAFSQLAEQGAVLLTQRRVAPERYEYIATRC